MRLSELTGKEMLLKTSQENTYISGLTADSRNVKPGYLFAALPGQKKDGRSFIQEALHRLCMSGHECNKFIEAQIPARIFDAS